MNILGPSVTVGGTGPTATSILQAVEMFVISSPRRLTAPELERRIAAQEGCSRRQARAAIRDLIYQGVLEYSYTFGQSYLVISFRNPVDVTSRLTIVPPHFEGQVSSQRHAVSIAPGVSFGSGRHPTTRLMLQAVEQGWEELRAHGLDHKASVIDIGTGSGILAIASAKLGADDVLALDIDACARSEARHNIDLNPGANVVVSSTPLESVDDRFHLIIANLRLPTLFTYSTWMYAHLRPGGRVVVSGFREEEARPLTQRYSEEGLLPTWQKSTTGWSAGVFRAG